MCLSPNLLSDGTLVACRKCPQCRSNRIDEWVGRCIAESKTSVATSFITLTYGRDEDGNESHARAAILSYSDVQKYFKQLRFRGYPCRYLVTGELGSKNERAHWHGLVFWQENVPQIMTDFGRNSWHPARRETPIDVPILWDQRFNEPCWPHGYSHWTHVRNGHERGSIAYACKYVNKDVSNDAAQSKLAMSKKPPLGAAYFVQRAQKFVDERISPQDPYYTFPLEAKRKNGNVIKFKLAGKVLDIFCQAFIDKWRDQVSRHYPPSDFITEYEDRKVRQESGDYEYIGRGYYERVHLPALPDAALNVKTDRWPMQAPLGYNQEAIFICPLAGVPRVETSDGKNLWYYVKKGKRGWRENIVIPKIGKQKLVDDLVASWERSRMRSLGRNPDGSLRL